MVGKAAATGEKKRGRPRKQREGQPPLSPSFASAVARRQQGAPPPPPAPARRSHRSRRPPRMDDYADYGDYEDDFYCEQLSAEGEAGREEAEDDEEESEGGAERTRREKKFKLLQKLPNHRQGRRSVPLSSSSSSSEDDGAGGRDPLKKRRSSGTGRGGDDDNDCADGGNLPRDGSGSGSEDGEVGIFSFFSCTNPCGPTRSADALHPFVAAARKSFRFFDIWKSTKAFSSLW